MSRYARLYLLLSLVLCFFIPGLELLFLAWAVIDIFNHKKDYCLLRIKNNFTGISIFFLFFPFIVLTGFCGDSLLGEYTKQDSIKRLQDPSSNLGIQFYLSVLVIAPIVEEFYFRKILLNEIWFHFGPFFAVFLSAIIFSAVHNNIYAFPILFALGLSLGIVKLFSVNIINSILCHSIFNLLMLYQIYHKG